MNSQPVFSIGQIVFLEAKSNGFYAAEILNTYSLNPVLLDYAGSSISWISPETTNDNMFYFLNEERQVWRMRFKKVEGSYSYTLEQINTKGIAVKALSISRSHSVFLSSEGALYGMGDNTECQLGLPEKEIYNAFTPIECSEKIRQVVATGHGIFALTDKGELLVCGLNQSGEFGLGDVAQVEQLTPVPFNSAVKCIFNYASNTFLLTEEGRVYSCGNNRFTNPLGYYTSEQSQKVFREVALPENTRIKDLMMGHFCVFALSSAGDVFGWGDNFTKAGPAPKKMTLGDSPIKGMYTRKLMRGGYFINNRDEILTLGEESKGKIMVEVQKEISSLLASHNNTGTIKKTARNAYQDVDFFFSAKSNEDSTQNDVPYDPPVKKT